MAEPALAELNKKQRASLIEIVGKSKQKAAAVLLMNGSRNQAEVRKETGMDHGNLSRLVSALRAKELIKGDEKLPQLTIAIPFNFFDDSEDLK